MNEIANGSLKAGDRLPSERDIAKQLGVSRTVVREALKSLEAMGYVESISGGGTFVKQVSLNNVIAPLSSMLSSNNKLLLELIEFRKLLEAQTASLAAQRVNEETASAIKDAIQRMKHEVSLGGTGEINDSDFHLAVAKAAGNEALEIIWSMCKDLLQYTVTTTLKVKDQPKRAIEDHEKIAGAIFDHDSNSAVLMMQEHLEKAYRNAQSVVKGIDG